MADVASALEDWSATAANNSPTTATTVGTGLAPNLQEIQAVVRGYLAGAATDVASASTTDLGAVASNYVRVTGTTTITGFGTVSAGIWKFVRFAASLTLTNNATSLILPGGTSILTVAGDVGVFISEGSGNWRCVSFMSAGRDAPAGIISPYAGSAAPSGWLLCYGQAVSRTTYAGLFATIGTDFGAGDASTTFNVPDFRGRAPFGKDDMGGSAANRITNAVSGITGTTLGASGGSQLLHQHTHSSTFPMDNLSTVGDGVGNVALESGASAANGSGVVSVANAGTGSSQNMPPAVIVNYIIKT
jgi:microcystin-dependent protein